MLKSHRWKTLFGLAVTVALLAWVLRDVSASAVMAEIRRADVGLLVAMVIVAGCPARPTTAASSASCRPLSNW